MFCLFYFEYSTDKENGDLMHSVKTNFQQQKVN